MSSKFERELSFERRIANRPDLSVFRRNATTWELLLLLAANSGGEDGLYNMIGALETSYMGQSALLKFLRQRREDGTIEFLNHEKRSKWRIKLSQDVLEKISRELDLRDDLRTLEAVKRA